MPAARSHMILTLLDNLSRCQTWLCRNSLCMDLGGVSAFMIGRRSQRCCMQLLVRECRQLGSHIDTFLSSAIFLHLKHSQISAKFRYLWHDKFLLSAAKDNLTERLARLHLGLSDDLMTVWFKPNWEETVADGGVDQSARCRHFVWGLAQFLVLLREAHTSLYNYK